MKILFIGDIVGSPGRNILKENLAGLKSKYSPDVVIVNGENAAGGKGITKAIYHEIMEMGVDLMTMGNHTWDKKEIFDFIDQAPLLIRPANFHSSVPGRGYKIIKAGKEKIGIINLQGRTYLPPLDCPFEKADELITKIKEETSTIFIDFHAEVTSEKLAMGWYLDGRVSAVVGTHTHVQTADERIFPQGTAYLTDAGMTGPYDGILGVEKEVVIQRFLTNLPARFEVTKGREQLNGVLIETDGKSGKAKSIKRISINEDRPFFS